MWGYYDPRYGRIVMEEHSIDPDESVCHAVTTAVSAFEDTPISGLPVLCDSIDPMALNTLFVGGEHSLVSFSYSNSLVVVYSGEYLTIDTPAALVSR